MCAAGARLSRRARRTPKVIPLKFAFALFTLSLAFAAQPPARSGGEPQGRVSARAKGRTSVAVTERGRAHTLDLKGYVDAAKVEDVSVLFLTRAGGHAYLVLDVCGPSKMLPDDRQCGAGTECNVVWLRLDARWRIGDARSVRYESCWSSVSSDGPRVAGRRLALSVEDFREEERREVTYDADSPAEGLKVTRSALPKPTP